MPNLGLTTVMANLWINSLRGVSFAAPVLTLQLHTNFPGDDGTDNVSAVTTRQAIILAEPVSAATTMVSTPLWDMTAAETLRYVSAWTGFDGDVGAVCWAIGALLSPKTVANGDRFALSTCPITFVPTGLAAA